MLKLSFKPSNRHGIGFLLKLGSFHLRELLSSHALVSVSLFKRQTDRADVDKLLEESVAAVMKRRPRKRTRKIVN